jgi:hypothetical protein
VRKRVELYTTGYDETLQGVSMDPYGTSAALGLRVPTLVNTNSNRYLFLLATRVLQNVRTTLKGIRLGADIGVDIAPFLELGVARPVLLPISTPGFQFSDGGNVSWHLVREPMINRLGQRPLTDTASFSFVQADTPSFLYQTFSASSTTALGQPVNYPVTLTGYTPPPFQYEWQSLAGYRSNPDISRFPWNSDRAWDSLNEELFENCRVSLYASVLQTNPARRPGITLGTGIATDGSAVGLPPEEAFIKAFTFTGETTVAPIFWRVYGALLFEDEVGGSESPLDATWRLPGVPHSREPSPKGRI